MKILEIFSDILLSLAIAILLPLTVYWGVSVVYEYPKYSDYVKPVEYNQSVKEEDRVNSDKQIDLFNKAKKPFENAMFFTCLIVGILSLIIGSFISINSLALGLIGGGILNIVLGLTHNPNTALISFVTMLLLLILIILLIIRKNRQKHSF